jgi:Kdo2-lipid IVA lauroyltransferase/acyltransferase
LPPHASAVAVAGRPSISDMRLLKALVERATTPRPVPSKLFELADFYRIPLWVLAKPVYAFAPISLHFRIAALKGTVAWLCSPLRRQTLEALERHLGETKSRRELRLIARRHFQFRSTGRLTRLWPQIRDFAGAESIEIEGFHHLAEATAAGTGTIIVTAHFGYARLIKPILRSRGWNVLLVGPARPPDAPDLPPLLTRLGSVVHTRLLHLPRASRFDERWERTVGEDLMTGLNLRPHIAALARNEALIILTDGRAAQSVRPVPVLGIEVYFAAGAVSLARSTGAVALPAFVVDDLERKGPGRLRLVIHPPLDLQVTQDARADLEVSLRRFAAVYEKQARTHPHNWHWTWVRDGTFDNPN